MMHVLEKRWLIFIYLFIRLKGGAAEWREKLQLDRQRLGKALARTWKKLKQLLIKISTTRLQTILVPIIPNLLAR